MDSILNVGISIVHAIQGWGNWLKLPMDFFSFLGTEDFYMLVLPVLYWCIDSALGIRVAMILMVSGTVNDTLKLAFHGPRPYWVSTDVKGLASETSFGVPSGHAQSAMSVWGMMAAGARKWWVWVAAGLIIFLIGFSRLYLGVHFPHDVLLGWLLGGLVLWLMLRFWGPAAGWLKKRTFGQQMLVAFLASLLLIVIELIPFLWLKVTNWQMPQDWVQNAVRETGVAPAPVAFSGVMTSAGTIFGLAAGLAWLTSLGGFKTPGPLWKLALRFLLGVIGVLVIRSGLTAVFGLIAPDSEALVPYILRYLRYVCIGAWVTGGAPWLFLRLKLAEGNR